MSRNASTKGRAKLLKWSTPAQFHFITDRYNDFNNTAGDRGERAKFWKSLTDDWSSVWDLNPKIKKRLRNYYSNMRQSNIRRGLLVATSAQPRRGSPSPSKSRSSSLTNISQENDENVDDKDSSGPPKITNVTQSMSPQINHFQPPSINFTSILKDRCIAVDLPWFEPSEIRTIFIAGDLLVRAERVGMKGKGKENEVQGPPWPSNYVEAKIELPVGIQVEEIQVTLDAGRLTVQFPNHSVLCPPIDVEDLDEEYTNKE